jgi:hypothetical protein
MAIILIASTFLFCSELEYGDSGSWVVESSTGKVYGHLIAANSFGEGYVVLLDEILHDIPRVMGDETVSVTIATENDLRQYKWRRIAERDESNDISQDEASGKGGSPPKFICHLNTLHNPVRFHNFSW